MIGENALSGTVVLSDDIRILDVHSNMFTDGLWSDDNPSLLPSKLQHLCARATYHHIAITNITFFFV
jgi:hypothetical protein